MMMLRSNLIKPINNKYSRSRANGILSEVEQQLGGVSFVPLLKGINNVDPNQKFTWHYPNKWKAKLLPTIDYMSAICQGD